MLAITEVKVMHEGLAQMFKLLLASGSFKKPRFDVQRCTGTE